MKLIAFASTRKTRQHKRDGMTLLEVLLAAVILAAALAALSQLATNGITASLRTEMETMAAVKCQTKLDEILSMPGEFQFDVERPCAESSRWTWIAELNDGPSNTLSVLSVTVKRVGHSRSSDTTNATSFQLSRLVSKRQFSSTDGFRLAGEQ